MSLSPDRAVSTYVLKGSEELARPARMSASLLDSPFVRVGQADPRLVDPLLQEVVEQAENEARVRGFRAGYDAGYAQGREAGMVPLRALEQRALERAERERVERRRLLDLVVAHVQDAVAQAVADREPLLEERFDLVTRMAVEIAESLVGHHLSVGTCAAQDAVRRALADVPQGAVVTLRMHPDDVAAIAALHPESLERDIARVQPDPSVERYGCVAVAQNLEVDAQMGPALANVKRILNP
ncbi:MAG: flagellar assembly protein FliH [Austwickia sp.]|nr:flagellar assembly protein FliH [Austwickia sp.]MBK8436453.1 flagellar assembly protein FliH [Austwickia sp.]MBK9102129.1 flagellar assembly protein FliH [Austwickia sp.]